MVAHRINYRKLGRPTKHRRAMLRNLATSLIQFERIKTTVPRAKELRRVADQMVTLAKRGEDDLHARRQALAYLTTKDAVSKLFSELGPRYTERNGGYTRVLRIGNRKGDCAPMATIEYVDRPGELRRARAPWEVKVEAKET